LAPARDGGGRRGALGFGAESDETVSVAVSQAEELHVPPGAMAELIHQYVASNAARTLLAESTIDQVVAMMRAQRQPQTDAAIRS
jgi:hypothetical protein